jgi:hypothetical protein
MIWNEAFSRASMFLTVLSAAMVALALVAQVTAFGQDFHVFALVVLPIVLLVGLGTYGRLTAINEQDLWLVIGMNRLRHAYMELAPELKPYFITGHNDDIVSVFQTYNPTATSLSIGVILTGTPNIIGAIDALVAGIFVALVANVLGASGGIQVVTGGVAGIIVLVALIGAPVRRVARTRGEYHPRFPSESGLRNED